MRRALSIVLILSLVTIPSMTRAQEASPASTAASKEAAAAPADAGQKSGALPWWSPQNLFSLGSLEINSWRDVLQVGRWAGASDTSYDSYHQTTRAADGGETNLKGRLLTSGVSIRNENFSLIDPRLVTGNIGLRFALQRSDQQTDASQTEQTAELIGYNFDATVLGEKPYNATLFANRSQNFVARSTGGTTELRSEAQGITMRWREDSILRDKEILPYFSALLEARQDHTQETTNVAGQSFRRDEKRTLLSLSGHNGFQTADLDFRFERINLENIIFPAGSYDSKLGSLSYSVDFGPNLNRRSDTRLNYNSRSGASRLSNLNFNERLLIEHADNLSTAYFYDYSQQDAQAFTTSAHSGGVSLQHVLYHNLTTNVGLFATHQTLPNGTIDTRSAQGSLTYTHGIPWNGRLTLGVGGSVQITDNNLQSALIAVIDAPFRVPPVLGAGAGFLLNEPFIVPESIAIVVVRGSARLPTVVGIDYTVLVEGERTRILPQPTSAVILPGDNVEVSYTFRVDPSIKFMTTSRSINAAVDWGWIGLSASHDDTSQKTLSGGDGTFLTDRRRDAVRLEVRGGWGPWQGRAEANIARYNYTQLVYDEWRASQQITFAPRDDLLLSLRADQFAANYEVPVRHSDGRSIRLDLDWYYRGWWVDGYASRRVLHDTQIPTDKIAEYGLRLKRTWSKLDIHALLGRTERSRGGVENTNLHFQLSAVRRF